MTDILSSLSLKPRFDKPPKHLVILLHGLGASGQDLITLAESWSRTMPETLFLSPNAPFMFEGSYPPGFEWFSMREINLNFWKQGIEKVTPILAAYIKEQLAKYHLSSQQLALVGFSQGGGMALHMGLHQAIKPACIVSFSGAVFYPYEVYVSSLPILLIHGAQDTVVPLSFMHESCHYFKKAGIEPEIHVRPYLEHSIDNEGIDIAGNFLKKHLRN